ncbi:undecaprenyldiphospho-muramoylpentapeptide beta-N-acetylglucosaminyltransferase [Ignavibacterium sp.]|uniref:undecaprenyldiphospho-muramoylpentapeptide beta-N-acetylglucosaminyltransferase n=1 Tax=Ignavibacterium sp. TaxID=2651167 RepID=UPI00307EA073
MNSSRKQYRFLFAAGGTGGHLYPAVAVAEEIKKIKPESEILFVGTKDRIEGRVIPKLGYKFKSIWIKGFARKFNWSNLLFPFRLLISMFQSLVISMKFKPKVAIGTGGYVAGPSIWAASVMGAKIILMESNSYPGITTRLLEHYADEVHLSFDISKKYLRRQNILKVTGNPVRENLGTINKAEAKKNFGLDENKRTILVLGGSLGASSINNAIEKSLNTVIENNLQMIWQTGKNYYERYKKLNFAAVKIFDFLEDMNKAYSACDLLVARAGATTIAELTVLGLPAILIPSPNVAENHQYHNAKALVDKIAALMIQDDELNSKLLETILSVINDSKKLEELSFNAKSLAKPNAAREIALNAIKYAQTV